MGGSRSVFVRVVCVAALLLLGVWLWSERRAATPSPAVAALDAGAKAPAVSAAPPAAPIPAAALEDSPIESLAVAAEEPAHVAAAEEPAVAHYRSLTRYPTSTRRIDENTLDLLHPGARHEKRRPLPTGDDSEGEWEVLLTADRFFIHGEEVAKITLELWHFGDPVLPDKVTMIAQAQAADVPAPNLVLEPFDEGTATTAVFAPQQQWPEVVAPVRVTAAFAAEDLPEQVGYLAFYFTAENRIPAVFTDEYADTEHTGDLVIDVGVDVRTAGHYQIDGVLYDATRRPFGWARYEGSLVAGPATARLRFYGLLFHDAQALPPYTLSQLRGHRLRPGDVPHRENMPPAVGEYRTTGSYLLAQFRDEENDSPRRKRMLEMYRDAIARGVRLTEPKLID